MQRLVSSIVTALFMGLLSAPALAAASSDSCLGDNANEIQQALHTLNNMPEELDGSFTLRLKTDECIDCVRMINRELSRISGVKASDFDPKTKHIKITTTRPVPSYEVLMLITLAGYGSDYVATLATRGDLGPPSISPVAGF